MIEAVDHWGKGAPRRIESDASWNTPLAWDRKAQADGVRSPFSAGPSVAGQTERHRRAHGNAYGPMSGTNYGSRLAILTKRAKRIRHCLPEDWGEGYG